jgi:hypothetical protein
MKLEAAELAASLDRWRPLDTIQAREMTTEPAATVTVVLWGCNRTRQWRPLVQRTGLSDAGTSRRSEGRLDGPPKAQGIPGAVRIL